MFRLFSGVLSLLVYLSALVGPAIGAPAADKRVALVVGNSAYKYTPQLPNPKNDAIAMAWTLKKFGFEVVEGLDLDKAAFDQKIRDFAARLKGADAGVFFYAGHGLQVSGENYLVPTDAKVEGVDALEFELVKAVSVQRIMEQLASTNILFLDACRNNPLSRNLARALGTRSTAIGRGLRGMEGGVGTLISFSTAPDTVAQDGDGQNSPYTAALVHRLSVSNDDLMGVLVAVRNDVIKATNQEQVPWEHSALIGRFYFNPASRSAESAAQVATVAPPPPPLGEPTEVDGKWVGRWGNRVRAVIVIDRGRVVQYIYKGKSSLIRRSELKEHTLTFGSEFYTVVLKFSGSRTASAHYEGTHGTNNATFRRE
jgi:hypothetical protein